MQIAKRSDFSSLLVAQFCGALNDNFFKLLVSFVVLNEVIDGNASVLPLILINVCFVLPFVFLSRFAGSLSDRWSKAKVLQLAKGMELCIAVGVFLVLPWNNVPLLLALLLLMGVHSAIFSPAKYGILPELVQESELSRANGTLEFWTFAAIISGTALGGLSSSLLGNNPWGQGVIVVAIAVVGLVAALKVSIIPPKQPSGRIALNPFLVVEEFREIAKNRSLLLVLLAIAYFWAVGALYQLDLLLFAKEIVGLGDVGSSALLAVLGIGIGLGSIIAGIVSYGRVELGLVPIGAAAIGVASMLLPVFSSYATVVFGLVFILGVGCGFYVVPLNSFFQQTSPAERRGAFLAALNVASYLGILFASFFLYFCLEWLNIRSGAVLFVVGFATMVIAAFICFEIPGVFIRCINWIVAHTLYSLRVIGKENIPEKGGALIICNHVAYVDPPLLLAAIDRPIRFLMFRPIYEAPLVKPIATAVRAIPVSQGGSVRKLMESLKEARSAVENGEIVCVFAEGELTRIGHMVSFKKGFETIMRGLEAPIIPAYIDQIWGSIFSHKNGRFFWKIPKEIPYPVTIAFGKPMPSQSKAFEVRQRIQEIAADLAISRRDSYPTLSSSFTHAAKRNPFRTALVDSSGARMRSFEVLTTALVMAWTLRRRHEDEKMIGVLLPPSIAGVLTNVALSMAGFVPVNLNYTAGEAAIRSAIEQCGIKTVISSEKFFSKLGIEGIPAPVLIEDIKSSVSSFHWCMALLAAVFVPTKLLMHLISGSAARRSDLATIIFSSGSTGEPKGVMLSHGNVASNINNLYDMFQLGGKDAMLGVLPFFHSFGFTGTLWLPLLSGIKGVYHYNPLDAGLVGELTAKERVSILISTPTFLLGYVRKCTKEQFQSLRYVVVGAEKLKERIAQSFYEKFGIRPLEGYGCTELSPVALLNIPDFEDRRVEQVGNKEGSAGHPLPSVAVRVVDPDSFSILPPDSEGLLIVRGPNVMLGYLNNPKKTAEVIRDGWYVTGDIAKLDEDGFVTITDRLSRFSKIGGEMVPHIKIEEAIHHALGVSETICAVTSVADEKRGEKLVVFHTKPIDVPDLVKKVSEAGLPNLWIPKKEHFLQIEALPILGTGKLDLRGIKALAAERFAASNEM